MDIFSYFHNKIFNIVTDIFKEDLAKINQEISNIIFTVESPKNDSHGDLSTNVAMIFAKTLKKNPIEIAKQIQNNLLNLDEIIKVDIAGPGFINLTIKKQFWHKALKEIINAGTQYAMAPYKSKEKVNVEYVSANPTGPLHIGHGRGAVVGSVLAKLYIYLGYDVLEEYYINDAGNQVNVLGKSLYYRYLELLDATEKLDKGSEFYPGEYLVKVAKQVVEQDGNKWLNVSLEEAIEYMKNYAVDAMLKLIKEDLAILGINHDVFVSEKATATDEKYNEIITLLEKEGFVYRGILNPPKGKKVDDFEPREQKLFKTTLFGDDIDRPLEKSSGERTYFANDVLNHNSKIQRGYKKLLTVLGADHAGYIKRIEATVSALSKGQSKMVAISCQLVNLLDNGNPVKMSKRAGNFVTLRDLIDEVGCDIFRFMMITRKNEVGIDFDLSKVQEQTNDNPLYYIQYAFARTCSVIRNAKEEFAYINDDIIAQADLSLLIEDAEIKLIKQLLSLPRVLESAKIGNDPHRLYIYLVELSQSFHSLWNKGKENQDLRFILKNNEKLTIARLSLLQALANVITIVAQILGIKLRESM